MKKEMIALGLVLVLAVPVVGAAASEGTGNGPVIGPAGFSLCPTIAETAKVRNTGVDYVQTREFAEAVTAVANGTSIFAPAKIPAEWKDAAADWKTSVARGGKPWIAVVSEGVGPGAQRAVLVSPTGIPMDPIRLGSDRSCDPHLLFRASIEYRSRVGQGDLPLLYPHVVQQASSELGKTVMAKLDMAASSAKKADVIASRILQAEKAGAGECQPQELARAKAELAVARNGITDLDFNPGATETVLARADALSGSLLAERRYAASRGMRCVTQ